MSQSGKSLTYGAILAHGSALFRIPAWGLIAIVAGGITLVGFAVHGFDENGLRLGNQLAWRFASLVYVAAIIAGPASRLLPFASLHRAGRERHQLIWGFCASFGVYLASLIVPNTFMPALLDHQGLTFGMVLFAGFGALLTMVVSYAVSPRPNLGERSRRAILGVGLAYFWLAYSLTDLSHLSAAGRADGFYGASLILMLVALLVRFADNFGARFKGARRV
jgi:hypothetical protein